MLTDNKNIMQNLAAEITEYSFFHEIEHRHSRFEVRYFITADASAVIKKDECQIKSGDLCVIMPGVPHRLCSDGPLCFISFFGIDQSFSEVNSDPSVLSFKKVIRDRQLRSIADRVYAELTEKNAFFGERLKALRDELAIELLRSCALPFSGTDAEASHHQITDAVNEYLNLHFKEKVRLEDIAAYTGFNKSYLSRVYKKSSGSTIWQRLGYLRCEYAKHLIETSGRNLEEISQMCGFENVSYFRKLFKAYTSYTPAAYRKSGAMSI